MTTVALATRAEPCTINTHPTGHEHTVVAEAASFGNQAGGTPKKLAPTCILMKILSVQTYLLPVQTRVPLKFGSETLTTVTCLRVKMRVEDSQYRRGTGWGETPLSIQWGWPSSLPYTQRQEALLDLSRRLAVAWHDFAATGHPLEIGHRFQQEVLPSVMAETAETLQLPEPIPLLAALIVCSAFDIALHDAFAELHGLDVYQTYSKDFFERDLSAYLEPAAASAVDFRGVYPSDFLVERPPTRLPCWHLVGGLDPLSEDELPADAPRDGFPVLLRDWIRSDGLTCLKIKLRGNDREWDYDRIVRVGQLGLSEGVQWLSTDFNCTVTDPSYVNEILDQLRDDEPRIYGMLLYVEQPFPYDLSTNRIDVHCVSARKPLFLDESAHDWSYVRLGRELGWSGVALKTCKTQSGAILSLCWAKAHGMPLMVQDLTNPMLAMIPHVRLAAATSTIMGVECNAMQFYPEASEPECLVHGGLYRRRDGMVDFSTLGTTGFGYRTDEIVRQLPAADVSVDR